MSRFLFTLIVCLLAVAALPARAVWVINGNPVCLAAGDQQDVAAVTDGCGGVIVVWSDYRCCDWNIYVERIDSLGWTRWCPDGCPICLAPGIQDDPVIVPDGAGGAIIAWRDLRTDADGDIFAQHVDIEGRPQWGTDGIPVCTAANAQRKMSALRDGAGGMILAWQDARSDTAYHIYAQRIDTSGNILWEANGVPVCSGSNWPMPFPLPSHPALCGDGAGGAIVAWPEMSTTAPIHGIRAQHIGADGAARWDEDGAVVSSSVSGLSTPGIASDSNGGAIVTWFCWSPIQINKTDIHAQRVDGEGALLWDAGGVPVCTEEDHQEYPQIVPDGEGGAIITWYDFRNHVHTDIYAQRIDSGGTAMWETNGVIVCSAIGYQWFPLPVPDGDGGAVIRWGDYRAGEELDIYVQKVNRFGESVWMFDGEPLCRAPYDQAPGSIVADGRGGAVVAWRDSRTGTFTDIFAMRICEGLPPLETLLLGFECRPGTGSVRLDWTLTDFPDGISFIILRSRESREVFDEIDRIIRPDRSCSFAYNDDSAEAGATYRYRVDITTDGKRSVLFTSEPVTVPGLPLALFQNHPNPFNPATTISYYLPERCHVVLSVYDVSGRVLARLVDAGQERGHHDVPWDGRNEQGRNLASGIYLYQLTAGKETRTRKMILLR